MLDKFRKNVKVAIISHSSPRFQYLQTLRRGSWRKFSSNGKPDYKGKNSKRKEGENYFVFRQNEGDMQTLTLRKEEEQ